jgi:hypothetical protein
MVHEIKMHRWYATDEISNVYSTNNRIKICWIDKIRFNSTEEQQIVEYYYTYSDSRIPFQVATDMNFIPRMLWSDSYIDSFARRAMKDITDLFQSEVVYELEMWDFIRV